MKTPENRMQKCALLAYEALVNPGTDDDVKFAAWCTLNDCTCDEILDEIGHGIDCDFMVSHDSWDECIMDGIHWLVDSDDELMQTINELRLSMANDIFNHNSIIRELRKWDASIFVDEAKKLAYELKYVEDCRKTLDLLGAEMDANPLCRVDDPEMLDAVVEKYGPRENNVYTVAEVYDRDIELSWANNMNLYVNQEYPADLEKYWAHCLGRMAHPVDETEE